MLLQKTLLRSMIFAAVAAIASWSIEADLAKAAEPGGSYDTIDSAQLATMLPGKDFVFINVHVPYEGEIPDTDANIPFDRIADNLDSLPADKSAKIVLYCRSGRMSEIAAEELSRLGYSNVSHLAGGMNGWRVIGQDLVGQ